MASTLHLNSDGWEAELWVQELCCVGEHRLCIGFFLWANRTCRQTQALSVSDVCCHARRPTCSHVDGQQWLPHVEAPNVQTVNIGDSSDRQQLLSHDVDTNTPRSSCMENIQSQGLWKGLASLLAKPSHPPSVSWEHPWWPGGSSPEPGPRTGRCKLDLLLYIQAESNTSVKKKKNQFSKSVFCTVEPLRWWCVGLSEHGHEGSSDTNPEVDDGRR